MSKKGKFILGAAIGAGLGLLFAPKEGKELRKDLMNKFNELKDKCQNINSEDVKKGFEDKINEIKEELKDLDKEKVLKIAKEKGQNIVDKCEELCKKAAKEATPVIEKAANELKDKTVLVLESTIKKIEGSKEKATK